MIKINKHDVKTLKDLKDGKETVILRTDYNVPIKNGIIGDDAKIVASLDTIKVLLEKQKNIVIISHLGRPNGKNLPEFSLKPIVHRLGKLLGRKINFHENLDISIKGINRITLLENIRFYPQEQQDNLSFAQKLSSFGTSYINDALSVSHRTDSSVKKLALILPAYAGINLERELTTVETFLTNGKKPKLTIIGGAKVSTKAAIIRKLAKYSDNIYIAGAMANTFLYAQGYNVGKSMFEAKFKDLCLELMQEIKDSNCKLTIPTELVVANELSNDAEIAYKNINEVDNRDMILDIAPAEVTKLKELISTNSSLVWNGPLGAFEWRKFAKGTTEIAKFISELGREEKLISIVGGGDTIASLGIYKDQYISTVLSGGAMIELIAGYNLAGLKSLYSKNTL